MSRIFHVSDLHFGAEDRVALDHFAAATAFEKPDLVVVTGDLTQRARSREFAAAREWLGALGAPVAIEEGNHDLPYFNPIERLFRPSKKVDAVKDAVEDRAALPDCVLVSLPTTARAQLRLNWSKGHVDDDDLARAVSELLAVSDDKVAIVVSHHPLVDVAGTDASGETRGGAEALRRIGAAGCDLLLTGHVHTPFDIVHDGVRMVGAGTLSERLRDHPPSYNDIRIEGRDIHVTHRPID